MVSTIWSSLISNDANSPIRALHSLRDDQASSILVGLKPLSMEWSIEQHEGCDGHLSLVLVHPSRDRTIIVNRDPAGVQVSTMEEDELQAGTRHYQSIGEVIEAVKALVDCPEPSHIRHTA